MGQQIPIPAETLRRLSDGTMNAIRKSREDDRKATAKELQRKVARAMEASAGYDGEFVSIDASTVSSLVAFGGHEDESRTYRYGAEVFLKQYGVWHE